jgi:hypothetical protein
MRYSVINSRIKNEWTEEQSRYYLIRLFCRVIRENNKFEFCENGCGKKTEYQVKTTKRWICSKDHRKCPTNRKKYGSPGKKNPIYGIKRTLITRKKISEKAKERLYTIKDFEREHPLFCKIEKLRYNPNNKKEIQARCKKCNEWFTPTPSQRQERIRSIENPRGFEEQNFYCSTKCKKNCIIYHSKGTSNDILPSEYNLFRSIVLKKDNYRCLYCGKEAKHVHHTRPKKLEPIFILDPDYAISTCRDCHYDYGHKDECSLSNIRAKVCI